MCAPAGLMQVQAGRGSGGGGAERTPPCAAELGSSDPVMRSCTASKQSNADLGGGAGEEGIPACKGGWGGEAVMG